MTPPIFVSAPKVTLPCSDSGYHDPRPTARPPTNDPDNYYTNSELVPTDMVSDLERAKIIITNFTLSNCVIAWSFRRVTLMESDELNAVHVPD
jgi:hypothetical protein